MRRFSTYLLICITSGGLLASGFLMPRTSLSFSVLDALMVDNHGSMRAAYADDVPERIVFVGDVLLARDVEKHITQHGTAYPFARVADVLRAQDVVGNFEATIPTRHEPTPDLSTHFSVNRSYLDILSAAGFTYLSQANNHSMDFGEAAFFNTKDAMADIGLHSFGTYQGADPTTVAYMTLQGKSIALIGINDVNQPISSDVVQQTLAEAAQHSDFQIMFMHWGDEYQTQSNERQQALARDMIDAGADAIIGSHPHVVEEVGEYEGVPIFYSLGNFLFDQYFSDEVQQGLTLSLTVEDGQLVFSLIPVSSIGSKAQPYALVGEERTAFLEKLAARSMRVVRSDVRSGTVIAEAASASDLSLR